MGGEAHSVIATLNLFLKEVGENRVKGGFHHGGNLWPKYCSNGREGTKIRIR